MRVANIRPGLLRFPVMALVCGLAYLAMGLFVPSFEGVSLVAPAQAHSRLISTDPPDGAALPEAPSRLTMTFNENVLTVGSEVAMTGPEGAVSVTAPQAAGRDLIIDLPALSAGRYDVNWRAVSADGHPIEGSFGFTVEGPAGSAAAPETIAAPTATGDPASTGSAPADAQPEASSWVAPAIGAAVVVILLVGGGLAWRRTKR